jgi:glucose/arabinose dehydrogenase
MAHSGQSRGGWTRPIATLGALPVVLALAFTVTRAIGSSDASAAAPESRTRARTERLPDLDQETPGDLRILASGPPEQRVYKLGFRSAVRNVGTGPLIIEGHGDGRCWGAGSCASPTMTADQLIVGDGRSTRGVPGVGGLRFTISSDHNHWHLLGFDRYELRRAGSSEAVVEDRKTGFCLGDRYAVTSLVLADAPAEKVYRTNCGKDQPGLQRVREGISVGFGDDYKAFLEYQDLPLTGLPDGRYVLVHRVNVDQRLREMSYANNAASLLLELKWRSGRPEMRILEACPESDACDRRPTVRTVATGLEIPWDIAFLPDGRALVTERPGRVRLLERGGGLRPEPVARVAVSARGEGGLLGLALDPEFSANRYAYLYFTTAAGMRLERWRWTGSTLERDATLVDAIAAGSVHDSGRIAFGPDSRLYVATGDAGKPSLAQSPTSLNGKFLALTPQQYRGAGPVRPTIVASGLRNPQGFDWQPGTGLLIANDHGPSGFDGPEGYDEIDVIVPGANYGWPAAIANATGKGRFRAPLRVYRDPLAPSGGAFVHQPGTVWTGDYVVAGLRGQTLRRFEIRDGRVVADEPLLEGSYGRLRTVREGPDDCLYVLTSNRDGRGAPRAGDDRILCVTPPRD